MQIIIKGRQMHVSSQLRQRIERKIQRLSRLIDEDVLVQVTVAEEQTKSAQDRFSVQISLPAHGHVHAARSEERAPNANAALDIAIDKIEYQLGRDKDRLTRRRQHQTPGIKTLELSRTGRLSSLEEELHSPTEEPATDQLMMEEQENEQIWSKIVEIKSLPTRSMTDKEVIALMEKDGASYYPFYNEETSSVNVMYRLEQGGYGLLIPAME
ncbi:ribosome hibernation-promoting factor, HPF/YfiA family [Ktedonobacter robiniae]|uniref:Ribosomal subunit interface protein n=1 Tax=Ktedonobacter robiniae TaxID=2778365 RepID=A0ABQ3URE6_9CHLR|nr:ribosome-associated translation inhibitor RaiA [Ktedonobacter robiniae]GHO54940.1 ribosomal subunit interface protein [Ktedonobacter robiniae]